jgi:2-polyprenyl-3-methyl-5-hydroxy-6-metoxy-1,4-benzoquinol methylase
MTEGSDAFAERVFGSLMGAFEIASIYLGDKLGLYDSLVADGPATSSELAGRTGIAERYAREWLEQQAAIGYLTVDDAGADPHARRFTLPADQATVLADRDSAVYLTGAARMFVAAMRVSPELLDAYRTGGGVGWALYGADMVTGQADTNRPLFLSTLGREWLPKIDGVHEALRAGGRVADIGCGTGWSSIAIALAYPDATVDGFDLDEVSVDTARQHAASMGVADRVTFHDRDAAEADPGGGYDLAMAFECIHDMPAPVPVLASMRRLAADRGSVVVFDEASEERFAAPAGAMDQILYGYSITICLPDGMSHPGSVGTGTVIRSDTMRRYAQEAGFADIEVLPIEHEQFRAYRLVG